MLDYQCFQQINALFSEGRNDAARRLLMKVQSQHIALHDEVSTLKSQVQEFEDIILLSKSLHFDRKFYWIKIANVKQGPFCPSCYERDGTLMKLESHQGVLQCAYCGEEYSAKALAVGADIPPGMRPSAKIIPFGR